MGPPAGRKIGKQKPQTLEGWSGCDQGIVVVNCEILSHAPTADIGHVRAPAHLPPIGPFPARALRSATGRTPRAFQDCV
eukprot:12343656-Alexandrium_andersonii.AAC.1